MPLGPFNMFYGFGASPILVDGTLMLPVDQDTDSYLLAVDAKTGKQRWKIDRAARHLRLFDADGLPPGEGRRADPRPRVVPADGLRDRGRPAGVVGARPRVRDEVGGEHRRRHALRQRLGLRAESAGHADSDRLVRRGPEELRHERRRRRSATARSTGTEPMDRMLGPTPVSGASISIATASSTRASGPCSARCSRPRTACSRSSSAARAT